ncbi:AfsR/SARP family transcriptional regulator [Streptomyces sp. NBC_01433]|uniref:AfsR/SARP family transcriptional regulator n=1 Tax=Streptomyces sp. NBC_01433 TaxID=2903864 RepID=UPI002259A7EC|nr:AfsR/SARP family transcriptional regulator [Streptomyces sp. NBC_01433]MCX4680170.1 AfsR/SARP family transcriptional regulator [Streptomyces sp. NBC_01433]
MDLGPARQRTVLAALLMDADRLVPLEGLAERVWGARPPRQVTAALHSYLSRLRRVLERPAQDSAVSEDAGTGRSAIVRRPGGYTVLAGPGTVDAHLFHDLVARARAADGDGALELYDRALALWRGAPFAGVDTPWFNAVRASLSEQRHACRLDRNDLALRLGCHSTLLPELGACHDEHPWDERLAAQLMVALCRSGRAADALRCFERVRCALAEELGSDPGLELRRLHQRVLAGDPALGPAGRSAAVPVTGPAPVTGTAGFLTVTSSPAVSGSSAGADSLTEPDPRTPPDGPRTGAVPHQLPPATRCFTGRTAELALLEQALGQSPDETADRVPGGGPGAGPVCVISGGAGVGKTSVALHWAHRNTRRFPDGQLYVDLRGFSRSGAPLAPTAALRLLLCGLGVDPGAVPAGQEALAGLYRSVIADRRVLIVLDDAADAEQVAALLPASAGAAVLVTSRRRLTGLAVTQGARTVSLSTLSGADSRELLGHRLGEARPAAEPKSTAALLEQCAGLPLALAVVAARAAARPGFPLAALAEELRDEAGRLTALGSDDPSADVRTALRLSYRALGGAAAGAFRLLSAVPGPDIGLGAAGSLLGCSPASARALLRELEAVHLVEQHRPGRFRVNALVRLYSAELREAEPFERALRRVLDHYLHTARVADQLLAPYPYPPVWLGPPLPGVIPQRPADRRAAGAWFRTEWACLAGARRVAEQRRWDVVVWQLALVLDGFQSRRGRAYGSGTVWPGGTAAAGAVGSELPGGARRRAVHSRRPGYAPVETRPLRGRDDGAGRVPARGAPPCLA